MTLLKLLPVVLILPAFAQPATVRPWEVFEVELTAQSELSNPFVDGLPDNSPPLARVTFTGPDSRVLVVAAFWDGGRTWRARFAPPAPGEWSFQASSSDPGLAAAKGRLRCEPWPDADKTAVPTRRGFLHVSKSGRHFVYADGTPMLWIGDTWWNWAKRGIRTESYRKLADDRAAKGFTVGQLFFNGDTFLNRATGLPDFDHLRHVEQFIAYANSRGITVWIHPWWSGRGIAQRVGAGKFRRWWRYVIHRLGAYNVIWVLAGEYNMNNYGGFPLDFWKDLGAMIRREDPYRRIIGAHPTPPGWDGGKDAPQWSTGEVLHNEPWLDYNQSQVGHGRWRNEMIPLVISADYARTPPKPTVVTEPWYEFIEGNPPGEDVRYAAWSAILSGAAGHTYGGGHIWWAHVPESPTSQGAWPLHKEFDTDTLDYPGAVGIGFLSKFLHSIEWWNLEPHPELVSAYPSRLCAAVPGKELVVYLRWTGAVTLDLRPSSPEATFDFKWLDLVARAESKQGTVMGGAPREFSAPEGYPRNPENKDWVLHVRKR
jgi:hypothetical protein